MPTLTGTNIINRAADILQDQSNVRWSRNELLDWLNDGQRVVVTLLPESSVSFTTVSATSQGQYLFSIPSDGIRLIDVLANTSPTQRAVRQVDRAVLDAQYPTWRGNAAALDAQNFMFDKRTPKAFMLFPPLREGSGVDISYCVNPAALSSESVTISLDDIFGPALTDYIVYRAYLKDAEFSVSDAKAKGAYETFIGALTSKKAADPSAQPFYGSNR
jgi:hypothetical protein